MAELKDRYDVIVVGAGMGGLTCGALPAALEAIGAKDTIEFLSVEQRSRMILPDLDFTFTPR